MVATSDTELPIALLVLFGFALVLGVLLHATRFGRYVYVDRLEPGGRAVLGHSR